MTTILGIDAAWTASAPSGIALLKQRASRWHCIAVAPSYAAFIALAEGDSTRWSRPHAGSWPDAAGLLQAAEKLASEPVTLVTIDMPVAIAPICRRRVADQEVSRAFGSKWCSAHSPNSTRPGALGDEFSRQFASQGYPLATTTTEVGSTHRLVEVYPHPALLTLLGREQRIPYKVGKASHYWKGTSVVDRVGRLLNEFTDIFTRLSDCIDDIPLRLPRASEVSTLARLKPYEDALDALICSWVGCRYLAGSACALGDETAAVWCPVST